MPTISLVTVLFNSDVVLDGFFKSLAEQTFKDYHLYLVDNTVNDISTNLLISLTGKYGITQYSHIKNAENLGVAKGNNQGIEEALSNGSIYTLLLNNDIEFEDSRLLEELVYRAEKDKESLIIPKILFYKTRKIWMAGGNFVKYKGIINHWGEGENSEDKFNEEGYCEYAPTCFMLVSNEVFKRIGLMDEKYFVYYDDTDFLYRAMKAGYKIKYLPKLCVLHKVSSSTGGNDSPFSIFYSNRNRIYFIRKNYTGALFLIAMSFTLTTRIYKYLSYTREKKQKLSNAIVNGFKM